MDTKIMTLNNDIANLTVENEMVENEKATLQNDEEYTSAKQSDQKLELSQVIFSIEMIEQICSKKTEHHTIDLPYQKQSETNDKNFNHEADCEEISLK